MTPHALTFRTDVGVRGVLIEITPELDLYGAGRAASMANAGRDSHPGGLTEKGLRDWQRGYDVVDYALNHPSP